VSCDINDRRIKFAIDNNIVRALIANQNNRGIDLRNHNIKTSTPTNKN
jgi:hypothetical protein